ncbi:RNA transcription, translation and transport factor protein-like [Rhopilema esculentum]|uniref:RNA transcription, translation and transport factor protein-like n=1 Tax=Rhopilema esculentum TaxID=499914 RepID=UPI0031D868E3|eukprot:gene2537-732_t
MFERKLKALGFHHPENFSPNDEEDFRNLIIWLEDQVIRLYKIEDRDLLRETSSSEWPSIFEKYLDDLACPVRRDEREAVASWLISHAVRVEYHENATKFNDLHKERKKVKEDSTSASINGQSGSGAVSEITGDDPDLKAGISSLSKLLGIPFHPDHITTLQAVQKIINQKLSPENVDALKSGKDKKKGKGKEGDYRPINEIDLGFQVNDSAVKEAAKILRLLHLHELRDLQTQINKAIVLVQRQTANPKTDQSLGKVGR